MIPLVSLFVLSQGQIEPRELPVGPEPTAFLSFCFSPDSKRILYSKNDDATNFDPQKRNIWIADADGSNPELVISAVGAPEWTRDGRSIVYVKSAPRGTDLCLFDLATKKEKSLGIKLSVRAAHCSPVADKMVMMVDLGNGITQDFTCNLDGTDVRQITFGPGSAFNPLWSPDGKHIVYFRELGDGKDQIYLMNPDGTGQRCISDSSEHNFYPDFGPDGLVSYTLAKNEKDKRIAICNDSGERQSVFPYRTSRLRWSPDGKRAIFVAGNQPTMGLYVGNADGSNPKRVGVNR